MRHLPKFPCLILFLLPWVLSGQGYIQIGGGPSGIFGETGESGFTVQGEFGYRLVLGKRYRVNVGLGLTRRNFSSSSSFVIQGTVVGEPPVPYRGVNTYRVRPDQLQLRLGLERPFKTFALSISALPRYRVGSQLALDFTYYSRGGQQLGEIDFEEVPLLNRRPQAYVGTYHQYSSRFSLGASLGGLLTISEHWRIGLECQADIFGEDSVVSSEFDCPALEFCPLIGTFSRDVPVRSGGLVLQVTYNW